MLHGFLVFAAEAAGEEKSHTVFYLLGGALVCWALILAVTGLRRAGFPSGLGARNAVIAVTALLVAGTAASAVLSS